MLKKLFKGLWGRRKKKEKPSYPSLKELKRERTKVFDRWTWETGSKEDREEFETLDAVIEIYEDQRNVLRTKILVFQSMKDSDELMNSDTITEKVVKEILEKNSHEYKQKYEY